MHISNLCFSSEAFPVAAVPARTSNLRSNRTLLLIAAFALAAAWVVIPEDLQAQGLESAATGQGSATRVVAEIDEETVTDAELEGFAAQYLRQKLYHGGSEEEVAALRQEALEKLIERRLLAKEAQRRGIGGDFDAVEAEISKLEARYGGTESWAQLEPQLPKLRAQLLESTRIEMLKDMVRRLDTPDEATLRAFYEENTELFTTPRSNRLSTILLSVHPGAPKEDWADAESQAKSLRERIIQGEDFRALAREHSNHESGEKGGDIGFLHEGELAPAIQVAVDRLEVGGVTEALHVLEGYVIFRLDERKAAELQSFEAVKFRASDLYRRKKGEEQWNELLAKLRKQAVIVINQQKAEAGGSQP